MYSGLGSPNSDSLKPPPSCEVPPLEGGAPSDPPLNQLRSQIKKVMIPLLIKIFELKLAAQQAKTPPSRLQKKAVESPQEILLQLRHLEEDIKLLHLWCLSCQKQIEKAVKEAEDIDTPPPLHSASSEKLANPAIGKSFSEAVTLTAKERSRPSSNWLRKFLQR